MVHWHRIGLSERSRKKAVHVEAPGTIVNIEMIAGGVRVEVYPDGDRYAGDPIWRAKWGRQGGFGGRACFVSKVLTRSGNPKLAR